MFVDKRSFRSYLLGRTLRDSEAEAQRYRVLWGLPVLSSDAISSVAYAAEEILLVLVPVVGLASFRPLLGIAGAIVALLFLLVICYRQVIDAYPQGGGSYSVAKHDIGRVPSLVAASSLIIDYVLTIAVSSCASTAAIVSAFPQIAPWQVPITIGLVALLTLGNLRGIRESSVLFGLPTYLFVFTTLVMVVVGVFRVVVLGQAPDSGAIAAQTMATGGTVSIFLVLQAFAAGCSALTGVEAVSNSVPNFTEPRQHHAKVTLLLLGVIVMLVFGGTALLASLCRVVPSADATVLAQMAMAVFGGGSIMFYVVQATTAVILLLAANTAYNGLPQLLSILAADRFLPKRFGARGTRLVFSNGVLFATAVAMILVIAFRADVHSLIPLYSVGVFLSFNIAQVGMVRHWIRQRPAHWRHRALINGVGAAVTGVICIVVVMEKFSEGAWVVLVLIAVLTVLMMRIHHHYAAVEDDLSLTHEPRAMVFEPPLGNHVVVPVEQLDRSFIKAFNYAHGLDGELTVLHVADGPESERAFRESFAALHLPAALVVLQTPYRDVNQQVLGFIQHLIGDLHEHETLTVVIPRLVTRQWWNYTLHNQTGAFLEMALMEQRDVAVVAIPYLVDR